MLVSYNHLFQFPECCLLNKRLTKVFFTKNFDLVATEKKVLNNHVVRMEWVASLKPTLANVPRFEDSQYLYEELQLMTCRVSLKLEKVAKSVIDLFQKYIPYHILLVIEDEHDFILNTSDKRINLSDRRKRTLETHFTTPIIDKEVRQKQVNAFLHSISFAQLDKTSLKTLHQGMVNAIVQFKSCKLTGVYNPERAKRSTQDMVHLLKAEQIETELIGLKSQLKKENQLNKQVTLNMEIQKKKQEIEQIKNSLI